MRFAIALFLIACDGPVVSPDASLTDSGSSDAGRDAGRDAGDDAGSDAGPAGCVGPPGLYTGDACTELAPGVRAFHPRFELWSDGDEKERFVYLPPGTRIDTSDPDRWGFPQGTRVYKTFAIGGVRLETRILEKVGAARGTASWSMRAYLWSADQRSVTEVGPFGEQNVLGTQHDIPTQAQCVRCHSVAQDDAINGFSAIQLAHDEGGVMLSTLLDEALLTDPIALADTAIPGDATAQAALGYLHANCGSCHGGPAPEHGFDTWLPVGVSDLTLTPTWTTSVCTCSVWTDTTPGGDIVNLRIAPGDPTLSVITHRMATRAPLDRMPPIASEIVHDDGLAAVSAWISSLDPTANGCPHGCPFP